MATLDDAVAQMTANGMPPFPGDGFPRVNSGKIIRYGPKGKAWYRLFEQQSRGGKLFISGAYGMWGRIDKTKVETDWSGVDDIERARMQRQLKEAEEREQAKRLDRAEKASRRAKEQYMAAKHKGTTPYLERKGVEPERDLRITDDGTLLVPMLRYDYEPKPELKGLQKIAPDGSKRFNAGMAKEGAAFLLGAKPKKGEAILVCEGLATGLSIRVGTGRSRPVFVAFDAYNLLPVAKVLRALYPDSPLVFCADDDYQTDGNPGKKKADQAAELAGNATVISPAFTKRTDQPWTDFNDLHKQEGLEALEKSLTSGLSAAATPAPGGARAKKKEKTVDWDAVSRMIERFTLIYPSDTAYDHELGMIVKLPHMRNNFGEVLVDIWQSSPRRRTVTTSNVVFDPTCTCDPDTTINLFRGLPLIPSDKGSCTRLLRLLHYLCSEDDAVFDWVLKWIAYPLQHRGAKMRTAIVMYGGEGTGKNMFWGAVRDLYGEHGGVITQMQLQNQFNEWLSAKLFLVANEVVTRQDIKHLVGYINNLITEPEVYINPKGLPGRWEANHANAVFLSNEVQPLQLRWDDRRNQVIRTPSNLEADFYFEVASELRAGGLAALYHYLMRYDLGDFSEHTKPIMTEAKRDLIDLGKSSTQLFWTELHEELVPLPYIPCLQSDLYRAYLKWCAQHGEKMPTKSARFSAEFMSMNGVRKRVRRVPDPDRSEEALMGRSSIPQRTVFIMGEIPPGEGDEFEWLKKNTAAFREQLRDYLNPGRAEEQF